MDELQAIRTGGGIAVSSAAQRPGNLAGDRLMVYYFHGNIRCPTCEAIEAQTRATVESDFAAQLDSGEMAWKTFNYEKSTASELVTKFEIQMPVVVLARMTDGEITDWKRLDQVWGLVGDKPAFAEFIRKEIRAMLDSTNKDPDVAQANEAFGTSASDSQADEVPVLSAPADIPLPQ